MRSLTRYISAVRMYTRTLLLGLALLSALLLWRTSGSSVETTYERHSEVAALHQQTLATPDYRAVHELVDVADPAVRERWTLSILRHSKAAAIPGPLLAKVISVESGFDSSAVNFLGGAYGLTQVVPRYWSGVFTRQCAGRRGTSVELMREPDTAICYGAHVLGTFMERERSVVGALSSYNTGNPTTGYEYAALVLGYSDRADDYE